MKCYLVGGAVRDALLGLPIHERDWVVTGAHPDELLKQGYQQVGAGFPVFLHPKSKEEYALARKERKTAAGHQGFQFEFSRSTTLEEDLLRRDLTINAMAKDDKGNLIDPYGGQEDLKNRCLRHVSAAFAEDPLRVLRVARFQAKLPEFHIHPDTLALMREMVTRKELAELSHHRLWQELHKCLHYASPWHFFAVLQTIGFMAKDLLTGIRQNRPPFQSAIAAFAALITEKKTLDWIKQSFHPPNDFSDMAKIQLNFADDYLVNSLSDPKRLLLIAKQLHAVHDVDKLTLYRSINASLNQHSCHFWDDLPVILRSINREHFPELQPGPELGKKINEKRLEAIAALISKTCENK